MGWRKDFLLKDIVQPILQLAFTVREIDEDYTFLDGILCAGDLIEGVQLLGNKRLASKAVIVAVLFRVLT